MNTQLEALPVQVPPNPRFDPPLSVQRNAHIHQELLSLPVPRPTSLLDLGCGSGPLISFLTPCDDRLPLQHLKGVDVDLSECQKAVERTAVTEADHGVGIRWRKLEVEIWEGDFRDIGKECEADVVVASEVVEHLDPEILEAFPEVVFGRLAPKAVVLTTPNREFNAVFELLEELAWDAEGEQGEGDARVGGFTRPGVPYRMRHHDHRFEWTRPEFNQWCHAIAFKFNYEVEMSEIGTVKNLIDASSPSIEPYVELLLPFRDTVGEASQCALFTVLPSSPAALSGTGATTSSPSANNVRKGRSALTPIRRHIYPVAENEGWPPSMDKVLSCVRDVASIFVPKNAFEKAKLVTATNTGCDLRGCKANKEKVKVKATPKEVWDMKFELQRVWRYHFGLFCSMLGEVKGERWPYDDTVDIELQTDEQEAQEPYEVLRDRDEPKLVAINVEGHAGQSGSEDDVVIVFEFCLRPPGGEEGEIAEVDAFEEAEWEMEVNDAVPQASTETIVGWD
ncbi:hypothetical protein SAICODRAFT_6059 [Saitoella complicata NRRL Y-17804]|uniref:Small RNA 2'-O-methyltransferase n=1 Tax=Saitoella complicata (strain BCRC 22490 / CBS 7301 / JCM 7358 / NBRC 10748 / NRRL Y-17804) TaxID=698492 RepID=A0A0E9N7Q2_SAICN|nr:uncharacterized protein SAICODRAFT_6059 [Saitoella complicata NRRL Y-17804]ODQ54293.1 hypothetical protein SAICODRAFT_6059 [Saitoella complicata NRRL Y-17804]GAO45751.1 hypothetical protein G7K_0003-t1 [Saitoella complicata NRRL Y-17804]